MAHKDATVRQIFLGMQKYINQMQHIKLFFTLLGGFKKRVCIVRTNH